MCWVDCDVDGNVTQGWMAMNSDVGRIDVIRKEDFHFADAFTKSS